MKRMNLKGKLAFNCETIATLQSAELDGVAGGVVPTNGGATGITGGGGTVVRSCFGTCEVCEMTKTTRGGTIGTVVGTIAGGATVQTRGGDR